MVIFPQCMQKNIISKERKYNMNNTAEEKTSIVYSYDILRRAYRANFAIVELLSSSDTDIDADCLATLMNMVLSDFDKG